ncbi:MAG: hypothetical protein ACKODM_16995 [Cytophagales bacterium]
MKRDSYEKIYDSIKNLVNEFDPCGLIGAGAPDDEYDWLIHQIILLLNEGATVQKIKELVVEEMLQQFALNIPTSEPYFSGFFDELNNFAVKARAPWIPGNFRIDEHNGKTCQLHQWPTGSTSIGKIFG